MLVEGVDHVYVPMIDAAAAFAVLSDGLGLPVLWPFTPFGSFSSGGVSVGSIKLEILEANPVTPWSAAQSPPEIQAIAFRPSRAVDGAFLAEVDGRGIARSAPERFDREGRPAWTNVYFTDVIGATAGVFVCDYHLPGPRDLALRRRVLEECGGGRLGVVDAAELVIAAADTGAAERRWQRLLDPLTPDGPLTWRPPVGPGIRLVDGAKDKVEYLALAVHSVEEATRVWREADAGPLAGFPMQFVPA